MVMGMKWRKVPIVTYRNLNKFFHLTYCTSIHPANGWSEVFANLQRYAPALKERIVPLADFGIGLRLSGQESDELLQGNHLLQLQHFLQEQRLYIFTLNGFSYGPFQQQPVKALVHAPDWREEERVAYTLRLIAILAALLPDGVAGSISTSPLSYKAWVNERDPGTWRTFTRNIVRVAETLIRVRRTYDKHIVLAIEPEPDGLLENCEEVVRFYTDWLFQEGVCMLACSLSVSVEMARQYLLEHIQVCLDTCHMALAYERPAQGLALLEQYGIRVGKVQISSALKVAFPLEEELLVSLVDRAALVRALSPFTQSTYLHQVVQRNRNGAIRHYADLSDALLKMYERQIEQWRIHFHVPIFVNDYVDHGMRLLSTQDTIVEMLDLLVQKRFCRHLEIETYTWHVLPDALKHDIMDSIVHEYEWVLRRLP